MKKKKQNEINGFDVFPAAIDENVYFPHFSSFFFCSQMDILIESAKRNCFNSLSRTINCAVQVDESEPLLALAVYIPLSDSL